MKVIVLSLGGSLIVPDGIDTDFLKKLKKTIEEYIKKGYKFVIYCGGGKLARNFQNVASKITKISNEELDWIGIHVTKLNAQLLKLIFKNDVENFIIDNPNVKIDFGKSSKSIVLAAGWLPGCSTDYDAVILSKNFGIKEIINMSNIDYVYDKDPKKYRDSKKIEKISWSNFSKLVGDKWKAGMNAPFDPIAAKEAQKSGIKVYVIGKDLKNLGNLLEGKKFNGTTLS